MMRPAVRRLIGGPSGAIAGIGGLIGTGGSLLGLPSWMRAGAAGTLAGWFTPTATISNLARLFDFSSASGADQLECYAEPGSNRWQFIARSSNTFRAVALINRTPPAGPIRSQRCRRWFRSTSTSAIEPMVPDRWPPISGASSSWSSRSRMPSCSPWPAGRGPRGSAPGLVAAISAGSSPSRRWM